MIVPNPALQQAVDRYRALAADGDMAVAVRLQNAAYTLCVLTGTRAVEEAMAAVRPLSSGAAHRQMFAVSPGGNPTGERKMAS